MYEKILHKKILILFFIFLFFEGCSNTISVKISNDENSNLNNRLDDVPITLIIYQLKEIQRFKQANTKDLITREDGTLGKDKIDSSKIQIAPKDEVIAIKVQDKDVPYIGILALFANDDKKITKTWAKTYDAKGFWTQKALTFKITKDGIKYTNEF